MLSSDFLFENWGPKVCMCVLDVWKLDYTFLGSSREDNCEVLLSATEEDKAMGFY